MFQTRNARKEYIVAKYAERRFILRREESDPCRLYDAVRSRDLVSLLQLYAEGADLAKPLVLPEGQVRESLQPLFFTRGMLLCWVSTNQRQFSTRDSPTDDLHLLYYSAYKLQIFA